MIEELEEEIELWESLIIDERKIIVNSYGKIDAYEHCIRKVKSLIREIKEQENDDNIRYF